MYIYRVVSQSGAFKSVWTTSLVEARKIKENLENGRWIKAIGSKYEIEKIFVKN